MASTASLPLNLTHVNNSTLIINRLYILFQAIAFILLIYYRASVLITKPTPFIPHLLISISELVGFFLWILNQSVIWHPVTRTVFPERLPADQHLPPIDVFICTADPQREPPVGVMNTLVSAMALNYPPHKLTVYLSDDGGCELTLEAMREAWKFGKLWVPFCKKYGVKTICPQAYFSRGDADDEEIIDSDEFRAENVKVQEEYEKFVQKVMEISQSERCKANYDHASIIEVIGDKSFEESINDQRQLPLLVYVSREKRPFHPNHFKAGALNTLLRVSSVISNSPYILGLDCDMYCNDRDSALQAMCFHLDPKLSSSLAFVQFPQNFHNISKYDIYNVELTFLLQSSMPGMDGIKGPSLLGTGYYLKREALYGFSPAHEEINAMELEQSFGSSNEFIKSLHQKYNASLEYGKDLSYDMLQETKLLASCAYEKDTKWGEEVGFRYFAVVEDVFTSFNIHCKNWISVFYMSPRPSFLGVATTSLNDILIQGTRYIQGLTAVALSRFSPLVYGPLRMSVLQSICYASMTYFPLLFLPTWILATIPQLCVLNGTIIYPEVKSPFFLVYLYGFILSGFQQRSIGAPPQTDKYLPKLMMTKGITCFFYGSMHTIMEKLGVKEASFLPTNKVINSDEVNLYERGIYNFQTSSMFLVPLCSLIILNLLALVVGVVRIIFQSNYEVFVQTILSLFVVVTGYPMLEGMMFRKDNGRIPMRVTCYSLVFSVFILSFGLFVLMH